MTERPYTAGEVAMLLGVHVNTVKRLPPSELSFFRVGHRGDRRYDPRDVRAYIAARTVR
jgi:DNA-binding transcriptional MerR regulator